jgi:hypothetical protein
VEQVKKRLQERPLAFEAALSMELILEALQRCKVEFRERVYTPWVTLWAFIDQVLSSNGSCSEAVAEVSAWLVRQGRPACSPDTGHYCAARIRMTWEFLRELFSLQYQRAMDEAPNTWKWLGKHEVKVVDGSTFSMADTPANRAAYPPDSETQPGTRFPLLRAVVLFSLRLGLVQDFAFGPYQGKGTGESSLFRQLYHCLAPGDVVLGDKYYCSYRDVCQLVDRDVHVVVKHFDYRTQLQEVKRLGKNDVLYAWKRPTYAHQKMSREEYDQLPESLLIRVVTVTVNIPGFRVQTFEIVTTLLDADIYTPESLADLYFLRWRGEMYLDDIKTTLGLDTLRCHSPEMIQKELLVGLLAYNTIRIQMAQAAECLEIPLAEISFKNTVCVLRAFSHLPPSADVVATKLATIVHPRVGRRPGRSEPRAVKRKAKPYDSLTTPRPSFAKSTET